MTSLIDLSQETKRTVALLLEECSEGSRETGFETLLANLAHDLNKGNQVNGYLVLLQLMAEIYPNLAIYNTERYGELRNSYQNRPNVGTALIWAVGQGGRKDLAVGLRGKLGLLFRLLLVIDAVNHLRPLEVGDLELDLLEADADALGAVLEELAGEEAVRLVDEVVVHVLADRHPLAFGELQLADLDALLRVLGLQVADDVDVGAAKVVLMGMPEKKLQNILEVS